MTYDPNEVISTARLEQKVEVFLDGERIAETTSAILLYEEGYLPVVYIPKNDVINIDLMKYDEYESPRKGHAELYTITHGEKIYEGAAWSYDEPHPHVSELQGRVAFFPDRVDEIRIS